MSQPFEDPKHTALLLIDMHRGHLDPEVATLPVDATWGKEILSNTKRLLNGARTLSMNIIHVVTIYRVNNQGDPVDSLGNANPYCSWRIGSGKHSVVQKAARSHNLEGSVQTQIMPEIQPLPGEHVVVKKRYSAFHGTDLDLLLRCLHVNALGVLGVNTNNCITATTIDGTNHDYAMIAISDCLASSYGRHLHEIALELIENTYGWVMTSREFLNLIESKKGLLQT
ncbi:MAG: cysteine hydrolase [Pseudomonadota bacterium]